jgi:hypothetical protein
LTQVIDVLVDTGSANLLVPAKGCGNCDKSVNQRLDMALANATAITCDDPRCRGECQVRCDHPWGKP